MGTTVEQSADLTETIDQATGPDDPASLQERARQSLSAGEQERKRDWGKSLKMRLALTDTGVIVLALLLAQVLRFGVSDEELAASIFGDAYWVISAIIAAAWIASLNISQSRALPVLGAGNDEYRRVINATLGTFGAVAIAAMLLKYDVARGYLAIALPLGLVLLVLTRHLWRRWLTRQRTKGRYTHRALIVGSLSDVEFVAGKIFKSPQTGYRLHGAAVRPTDEKPVTIDSGHSIPIVATPECVMDAVTEHDYDTVIVAGTAANGHRYLKELSWSLEGTNTSLVVASKLIDVAGPRIHWKPVEGLPLMSVEMPQFEGAKFTWKRVTDILASSVGLLVLAPVMLAVALAIKLDDRGPVFFRQERVGIQGSRFGMMKFRSMVVDAEARLKELEEQNEGNGALFKMKRDPRITRVGAFIRKYSLDELPQLWNVLVGEMSLVGPRPPLPREVAAYEQHTHRRLLVRPGITGLWQVSGRSDLPWEESVRLDLYYVENWSLAGDLTIIARTVKAVVAKDGAY
ncbi:putative undecaprenyl-phosphate sugar phosphotransferase [Arthrobacter crystallopoietes BAB-32]|uniref:Putative undecaprenyl-phosphate sugar phosphotransferase n=1 Tax=Arthrobacter crystallopoietes BAB-32 TaxID=1246476 RepID=N1UT41_9MICC|nr:sugar transferase [Arthrobacter crystallopoietes]EMY33586.1 putative undecaprenyl-phosphate sugar phosphotransferase [Arthrobacter crystallopoietes BAB-32]